ncbi:putative methyltransferase, partial [Stegodyphus mimosarum]
MASALFQGSAHAVLYSKFRPFPPAALISNIINYVKLKTNAPLKKAVDVGCGSGQSTVVLAKHFENVVGLDVSAAQIECAKAINFSSNIEYKVANGEKLPFSPCSVNLVTLCQAVHWFETDVLFKEVERVLIPNGVISVYGYWIPLPVLGKKEEDKKISDLIKQYLHEEKLGQYWDKERYIVKNHYSDIHLPFKDVHRTSLVKETECSLADYIGYLSTWSAYQKLYRKDKKEASNLLSYIQNELSEIIGEDKSPKDIIFKLYTDYFMIMGHR